MSDDCGEVDTTGTENGRGHCLRGVEEPFVDQMFDADEQRVAGKSGETLIWRIAVAGGTERQYLPHALSRGGQQLDEVKHARAEVADSGATRQRRRMKKHTARTWKRHRGR